MKDRTSRVLAIIALVFMLIFIVSLTATIIDASIWGGGIAIIALCSGVVVLLIFIALKMDGRGFSLSKMKTESEIKKIEQAIKAQDAEDRNDDTACEVEQNEESVSADGGSEPAENDRDVSDNADR